MEARGVEKRRRVTIWELAEEEEEEEEEEEDEEEVVCVGDEGDER